MPSGPDSSPERRGRVVLASGNPGKLRELSGLMGGLGLELAPQSDLGVREVAETGATFVENALIKARHASLATGLPAIADDSGLAVPALHGAPGLRSARFAGPGATDEANNAKLLAALAGLPPQQRSACFVCVMVYLEHPADPIPVLAEGRWWGRVLEAPRGANGFGYDPLFLIPERGCSSAELEPAEKARLSHRAQASRRLLAALSEGP